MDPINQVNQTSGSSKKTLYIIIGVLVLIIIGYFLRDSFGFTRKYNVGGYNAEVTKKLDGSTTYKSDYGTMTTNTNKLPDNWPSDVPAYPNSTITSSGATSAQAGVDSSQVMYTTRDSAQTVLDFYKKELTSSGWTSMQPGKPITGGQVGAMIVLSAKKDKRTINVGITNADGESKVTVMIFSIPTIKTGL